MRGLSGSRALAGVFGALGVRRVRHGLVLSVCLLRSRCLCPRWVEIGVRQEAGAPGQKKEGDQVRQVRRRAPRPVGRGGAFRRARCRFRRLADLSETRWAR